MSNPAPNEQNSDWRCRRVMTFAGRRDTRSGTTRNYKTISLDEVFNIAPTNEPKDKAPAIIPSSYSAPDGRNHASQREHGEFQLMTADIDKGDISLERLLEFADETFGPTTAYRIYSTASAKADDKRWRFLVPLKKPLTFALWNEAQEALFDLLAQHGISPDRSLSRAGQPIYLPNISPTNLHNEHTPSFYVNHVIDGCGANIRSGPLAEAIELARATLQLTQIGASAQPPFQINRFELNASSAEKNLRLTFNKEHRLDDLLSGYGYKRRDVSDHWRSPAQTSSSYATRCFRGDNDQEYWVSLSSSDAATQIGKRTHSGNVCGDAFDLFVHFEHGGDIKAALATIKATGQSSATRLSTKVEAKPYRYRNPASIPRRTWLLERWLLAGTVAALIAPGGSGKSTLSAALALSVATGQPLLNLTVWQGAQPVWIWNLEDDLDELSRSIQAVCDHFRISASDLDDRLFVNSGLDGSDLCTAVEDRSGIVLHAPVFEALTAELVRRGIKLLMVDPFVSSHEVEENSNSKIDKIVKAWGRVAKASGCVVLLIHHTSKAGSNEVTANSARGASALANAARSVLVINRMSAAESERMGVPDDARRRYFNVMDDKHNRAPAEDARWFKLVSVELANGDSIGVTEPWAPTEIADQISQEQIALIQSKVAERSCRNDSRSPDWIGHTVAGELGLDTTDPHHKKRVERLLRHWVQLGYFAIRDGQDARRQVRKFVIVAKPAEVVSMHSTRPLPQSDPSDRGALGR